MYIVLVRIPIHEGNPKSKGEQDNHFVGVFLSVEKANEWVRETYGNIFSEDDCGYKDDGRMYVKRSMGKVDYFEINIQKWLGKCT
jgi:hypothetical protein